MLISIFLSISDTEHFFIRLLHNHVSSFGKSKSPHLLVKMAISYSFYFKISSRSKKIWKDYTKLIWLLCFDLVCDKLVDTKLTGMKRLQIHYLLALSSPQKTVLIKILVHDFMRPVSENESLYGKPPRDIWIPK